MLVCKLDILDFTKRYAVFSNSSNRCRITHFSIQYSTIGGLPSSITQAVLIGFNSIALVWLYPHMDPWGTILLDETIHALDSAICPVSAWYGSQYIIHLSNSGQAPNNEGAFWSVEGDLWTKWILATSIILTFLITFLITWPDIYNFASTAAIPGIESAQSWVFWVE